VFLDPVQRGACSTPFGIIGIHTAPSGTAVTHQEVLNAFRHHWNSHRLVTGQIHIKVMVLNAFRHHWNSHSRRSSDIILEAECAQRLSASLEFTRGPGTRFPTTSNCAQRLSASLEFTQLEYPCRDNKHHVLNAFRHHWNSHNSLKRRLKPPL